MSNSFDAITKRAVSRMTIGDRLREAKARRLHVSDIREPLVKALWWKSRVWALEEACGPPSMDPDAREATDALLEEAEIADRAYQRIIRDLWLSRQLERSSTDHSRAA